MPIIREIALLPDREDHDQINEISDRTPLLPSSSPSPPHSRPISRSHNRSSFFKRRDSILGVSISKPQIYVTLLCFLMVIWVDFGTFVQQGPKIRLYESIACADWYREHDPGAIDAFGNVPEDKCKLDPIQDRVAKITGWQPFFDNIPAIVMALPMGTLADKYGRKPTMAWNYFGLLASVFWDIGICFFGLKLELVWLQSLFLFIGGGSTVIVAILLSVLSDVTPEEDRATTFFRLSAMVHAAALTAPPVGTYLLQKDIWLPQIAALIIFTSGWVFFFLLPETKDFKAAPEGSPAAARVDGEGEDDLESDREDYESSSSTSSTNDPETPDHAPPLHWLRHRSPSLHHHLHNLTTMISFVFKDYNVTILVCAALVNTLGRNSLMLLLQYISKRYNWTLAKANIITSVRSAFVLMQLLIFLPFLSHLLLTYLKLSPTKKDLWICRASVVVLTAGMFLTGLSPTVGGAIAGIILYALGDGYSSALRSLVTALVDPHNIGRLYSTMAICESIGAIVAGPLMTSWFRWGIKMGGVWIGMPFTFSGFLFAFVLVAMFMVRVK